MTKAELVAKVAKDSKTTKAAAGRALDGVIDGITKALKKGDIDRVTVEQIGGTECSKCHY